MAFDGVTVASLVAELNKCLAGGRIYKIYQPEMDELNIIFKPQSDSGGKRENIRLLLSASASLPLAYISRSIRENPLTAPNFCMLLRKHIGNGRLLRVYQPDFERIMVFEIAHLDELGDMRTKKLIVEIMGKHSNIIFVDEKNTIIDSIKHISGQISSVREVLPGRTYVFPPSQNKKPPYEVDEAFFMEEILAKPLPAAKAIYSMVTGFSSVIGQELCYRAGVDGDLPAAALDAEQKQQLWQAFSGMVSQEILKGAFAPAIYMESDVPVEYGAVPLTLYGDLEKEEFESISQVLYQYYALKDRVTHIRQKSSELRRIVSTAVERTSRKYDLQLKQLRDTEKREKFRIYGELLQTYGYSAKPGAKSFQAVNYYDGNEITIPLDDRMSALDNAKKYFEKYNKLKRTYEALSLLVQESKADLEYLLSVQNSLNIAMTEQDLQEIRQELIVAGFIRKKQTSGKNHRTAKSKPLHYISSDGFHMYVGKNNLQNEEITFKLANGNDLWFHAKKIPGSHVIVKLSGREDVPDTTYEEAGRLAAYYSSGRDNPKVEIDYTRRMQLKKPVGAKPGYVIYHTNYSMVCVPDIQGIQVNQDT